MNKATPDTGHSLQLNHYSLNLILQVSNTMSFWVQIFYGINANILNLCQVVKSCFLASDMIIIQKEKGLQSQDQEALALLKLRNPVLLHGIFELLTFLT